MPNTSPGPPLGPEPAADAQRRRKVIDKHSMEYVVRSGVAGGLSGCAAKTLIAPMDRIKILFQTSNPDFVRYRGSFAGLLQAARQIWRHDGVAGLFQGHSATLLRIFPYAAIKFVAYEQIRSVLIPNDSHESAVNRFMAGSLSGLASVFLTYPLDLIRVRLAFQTRAPAPVSSPSLSSSVSSSVSSSMSSSVSSSMSSMSSTSSGSSLSSMSSTSSGSSLSSTASVASPSQSGLWATVKLVYHEHPPSRDSDPRWLRFMRRRVPPVLVPLSNFYRGFGPTILGMIPYAGVSFYVHDAIQDVFRSRPLAKYSVVQPRASAQSSLKVIKLKNDTEHVSSRDSRAPLKLLAQLTAGGLAGMCSQTAAYPFEVIRRRMQVGGAVGSGRFMSFRNTARLIFAESGPKGFFVGLTIGYMKVVPMVACSFYVYERSKLLLGI